MEDKNEQGKDITACSDTNPVDDSVKIPTEDQKTLSESPQLASMPRADDTTVDLPSDVPMTDNENLPDGSKDKTTQADIVMQDESADETVCMSPQPSSTTKASDENNCKPPEPMSHDKQSENNNNGKAVIVGKQVEGDCSPQRPDSINVGKFKNGTNDCEMVDADESGKPEEVAAFMKELESFYRERNVEFKAPKFYGEPINCLKLWRAVIRLGGYELVTASKLWRQVGESFHPPKTCTTVSWTFRIFYEKALLEYEKHKRESGELQLPSAVHDQPTSSRKEAVGNHAPGAVRARRDAAARAMQGWHAQRNLGCGEVGEPIIKEKPSNSAAKRERNLKNIGLQRQKTPGNLDHAERALNTEGDKQLVTAIADIGPPADWVKINVRQTRDCFEVYALVPGLLREEVRVQSDPQGRVVITGQPEQVDNPWGITPFQKVVSLPARIDPRQTTAVVSLHGRLLVRLPIERGS